MSESAKKQIDVKSKAQSLATAKIKPYGDTILIMRLSKGLRKNNDLQR